MKNIVFFYPSFENGGASLILVNLIKSFSKNKKIFLITNKKIKELKKVKNLKIMIFKEKKIKFINDRIISSFFSILILSKLIFCLKKKNTLFFSMQSHFFPVLMSVIFNFKLTIRVSEDPCGAFKYADNKLFSFIITLSKIITYNFAYKIITNAKKSQNCVKRFTIKKNKVKVLYNPTIDKKISSNRNYKKNYILNVGRLCKQKNQITLIKAFSIFIKTNKNYKLYLCGDGPDKKKLENYVNKNNLKKKIIFLGWKKNLKNIYSKAKLFVLTSLYEGMPNCLIDAVNHEIPLISSKVSGVNDIMLNNRGGVILETYNPHILAKKIDYVLKNYINFKRKVKFSKKKIERFTVKVAFSKYKKELIKN
jgi:GalNAc-alpha-(1->4)-GalNAc-alpha-(1->3)-diNAcBac-PP-undecaprenol alpha-1,4-N-acetyl-D-galactosaminyltransferase